MRAVRAARAARLARDLPFLLDHFLLDPFLLGPLAFLDRTVAGVPGFADKSSEASP